jgi:Flp pilus assembly protein TadD
MSNWFSKLFGSQPATETARSKPQLTREEMKQRVESLRKRMKSAILTGDEEEKLQLGNELTDMFPREAYAWEWKISALEKLGRHAEADAARRQAARVVGK